MPKQTLILKGSPRERGNSASLDEADEAGKQPVLLEQAFRHGQKLAQGRGGI